MNGSLLCKDERESAPSPHGVSSPDSYYRSYAGGPGGLRLAVLAIYNVNVNVVNG